MIRRQLPALVAVLVMSAVQVPSAMGQLSFWNGVSLPYGGEIISFSNGRLLATNSGTAVGFHGIQAYSLTSSGSLTVSGSFDLSSVFGGAANIASISSVVVDSRGFGIASVIPVATGSSDFGRVAFFDSTTGAVLKTLDVGYHPDSVSITPDGTKILVANEGEYGSTTATPEAVNRAGSMSVVDLTSVAGAGDVAALTSANVATFDFTAANLASGVTLAGVRNARLDTAATKNPNAVDIEPEYIAATNDKAYLTLQENNAIAVFDFTTGKYEAIHQLGSITKLIDASDREVSSTVGLAQVNDTVRGLPMPDTMVRFSRGGTTYLVTANEGDARPDDGDTMRINQEGVSGRPTIDATVKTTLDGLYGGNFKADAALGRLNILKDQGDTDADGDIDQPTALGTRSFSIWNASSGTLAFDSGSMIEQWVVANDQTAFNINSGLTSEFDKRSDDKGPEPEALAFGSIAGRDYVFVGTERQNGIFQFDVTDFANVSIVGYFNPVTSSLDSGGAFISPESLQFIAAGAAGNSTGLDLLVAGFEGTGSNGSIAVFAVPEPQTTLLLASGGLCLLAAARRRFRKRTA
jgi:hypothetical protein